MKEESKSGSESAMPQSTALELGPIGTSSLKRLMQYHDRQFVELAYQLILGRAADEAGLAHHLESLRSGENRQEVAFRIVNSEEGHDRDIDPELFKGYRRWRRIERIPILGTIFLLLLCMARIRYIVREFRRLQNIAYGGISPGLPQGSSR